nr:MAG TPA: hypothetical protein [Caudoviricetes sp.]
MVLMLFVKNVSIHDILNAGKAIILSNTALQREVSVRQKG